MWPAIHRPAKINRHFDIQDTAEANFRYPTRPKLAGDPRANPEHPVSQPDFTGPMI
jgi:hypothetical protein